VVRQGEIVGLCGLVGSGRTEVVRAIFGADKATAGQILFDGQEKSGGPDEAARLGLALIPESRKAEGLALIRSVGDNLIVSALRKIFPRGFFDQGKSRQVANDLIRQLRIATPSDKQAVGLLSGGNQQKVVIGKWLAPAPSCSSSTNRHAASTSEPKPRSSRSSTGWSRMVPLR
jgi:ribose transport system ATP-binding protein